MRAYLFFIFLLVSFFGYSQNIDSLKLKVEQVQESERFEVILNYMRVLLETDTEASYTVSEYALNYAQTKGDSLLITRSFFAQGFLLRRLGKEIQAGSVLKRAYGIAKRNNQLEELSKVLNLLAISYTYSANYDEALKSNFEALTVNEGRNDIEDISISCNNIGLVYFKLRNYEEALKYYNRSLEAKRKIKSDFDLDRLYINMALCYNQLREYEDAQSSIESAFAICKTSCSDEMKMEAELCLGISLLERGGTDESKTHFEVSLGLSKKLKVKNFEIECLSNIASIYLTSDDAPKALSVLQEAETIAKSGEYLEPLLDVYKKFSSIYEKKQDYKNSAFYSKKYSDLRDSVLSEELINNLATIQSKYAERENLSTIADNEKVIEAQQRLNYAIAIIIFLSFVFIFMIMRNSRMVRSLNSKLAILVQEKTMELVKANHSLKQVNDELDNLVYKTSHDIRGPLATLKGVCNIALMDVKDDTAIGFLMKLDVTASQLNLVLDKFSRVNEIYNTTIRPEIVNIEEQISEMVKLQQKIPRQKAIKVTLEISPIPEFETEPQLFYYTINNIIDNAFRYYNESQRVESFIKIKVERNKDEVIFRVIDNGVGIPINIDSDSLFHMFTRGSEKSLTGGMGLFISTTAARKLQGEIKFRRSADFELTEFIVVLPIKMDYSKIETPKFRGKILPATTGLRETLYPENQRF
jgi:signal transduction histidine kinase